MNFENLTKQQGILFDPIVKVIMRADAKRQNILKALDRSFSSGVSTQGEERRKPK
jgi:hypothetical protein